MPTNDPHTIGPTLSELLDQVIFSDPATHPLREEWERIQGRYGSMTHLQTPGRG